MSDSEEQLHSPATSFGSRSGGGSDSSNILEPSSSPISVPSPSSSPLQRGRKRKRPSYGAYRDDPSIPIPRQTQERWNTRAMRTEPFSASSESDDESSISQVDGRLVDADSDFDGQQNLQYVEVNQDNLCHFETLSVSCSSLDSESNSAGSSRENSRDLFLSDAEDIGGDYDDCDNLENVGDVSVEFDFESEKFIYPGCSKTVDEAVLELLENYVENNLTLASLEAYLKLLISTLPPDHNMPSSVTYLFKYIKRLTMPLMEIKHIYCLPAMHYSKDKKIPCYKCGSRDSGYFFELPIDTQLKFLFEHRDLASIIDGYKEERLGRNGGICDAMDGSEYRRVWSDTADQYKITLILNTDGVVAYNSSAAKFWPILFTIMEVPPRLRSSLIVVWGIWFDKSKKPNMNMYFKPFAKSLKRINDQGGVSWKHPLDGSQHESPVRAPLVVADAPARANVQGVQEHGGKHGCNTCEQKTSKLPAPPIVLGQRRKARQRRFVFKENDVQLRTHDRILAMGDFAEKNNLDNKKGVKRVSILSKFQELDLSTCVLSEYMHSVLKGVVLQFGSLWIYENGPWYIGDHLEEINYFLIHDIHPPDYLTRLPRSLQFFSYFKANELRSWLLYYSLIIISKYMKEEYVQHWMLFVNAIFMLLQEIITENDLDCAEVMLRIFVRNIGQLYGDKQYTYNVHQMLHLPLYVRRWGPLWATSAFPFESFNGVMRKMIHGSKNQGKELINDITISNGVQMLRNMVQTREERNNTVITVLGKAIDFHATLRELECLSEIEGVKTYFGRAAHGKERYSSVQYDKNLKRHNSYVQFQHCGLLKFGRVIVFFQSNNLVQCLISVFKVTHVKVFYHRATMHKVKHIMPVHESGNLIICDILSIVQKVIQVGEYICTRPNSIEKNL